MQCVHIPYDLHLGKNNLCPLRLGKFDYLNYSTLARVTATQFDRVCPHHSNSLHLYIPVVQSNFK